MAQFRKGRRLTQIELANIMGIRQREISRIENGEASFLNPKYVAWLMGEQADLNYIFTGIANIYPENPAETPAPLNGGDVLMETLEGMVDRITKLESQVRKLAHSS